MSVDSLDAVRDEAFAKADEADTARDEALTEMAPQGDFSMTALNKVVDALNAVLPSFGPMAEEYPTFSADEELLPPEFVNQLMMVATAAADADMEDVLAMVDVEGAADDRDLQLLAGKLRTLSESRDFKQFLKQPMEGEAPMAVEEEVTDVEVPMEGGEMEVEEDDLLMQRM
jgi:hypothetical protein|tara:strand:- start:4503 stop:5018 length:516 start_codon:yes stop_codon:yes gene_type:complete